MGSEGLGSTLATARLTDCSVRVRFRFWSRTLVSVIFLALLAGPAATVQSADAQDAPTLTIEKTSNPGAYVHVGQAITIGIRITNPSEATVTDIEITESFRTVELMYVPAIELDERLTVINAAPEEVEGELSWSIAQLDAGESVEVEWRAEATTEAFTAQNIQTTTEINLDGVRVAEHVILNLKPAYTIDTSITSQRLRNEPEPVTKLTRTITWTANTGFLKLKIEDKVVPEETGFADKIRMVDPVMDRGEHETTGDDTVVLIDGVTFIIRDIQAGGSGSVAYSVLVQDSVNAGVLALTTNTSFTIDDTFLAEQPSLMTVPTPSLDLVNLTMLDQNDNEIAAGTELAPGDIVRVRVTLVNMGAPDDAPAEAALAVSVSRQPFDTDPRGFEPEAASFSSSVQFTGLEPLVAGESVDLSYEFTIDESINVESTETRQASLTAGGVPIAVTTEPLTFAIRPLRSNAVDDWLGLLAFVLVLIAVAAVLPRLLLIPSRRKAPSRWRNAKKVQDAARGDAAGFAPDRDVGLALSGGGYRAAAFGLGVMLYLADSHHDEEVGHVTSVSGGSITNAFVASRTEFGRPEADPLNFWEDARPLAHNLSHKSLIKIFEWRYLAIVLAFAGLVLFGRLLGVFGALERSTVAFVFLILGFLNSMYQTIGLGAYARMMGKDFFDEASLSQLNTGGAVHVLCATDLPNGKHFYFSGKFVFHPKYPPRMFVKDFPVARAVQASAAFPGVFPPVKVTPKRDFEVPQKDQAPRPVRLVDGGVHDNLGATWLNEYAELKATLNELEPNIPDEPIKRQIVVNAAAPTPKTLPWWQRVPIYVDLRNIGRSMEILHQSNSAARASDLEKSFHATREDETIGGVVIDINDNPSATLKAHTSRRDDDGEGAREEPDKWYRRARQLEALLEAADLSDPKPGWATIVEVRNPGVKTNLRKLGNKAETLLLHGYVSAMVQTCLYLGWSPPDRLRTQSDFQQLCDAAPPPEPVDQVLPSEEEQQAPVQNAESP